MTPIIREFVLAMGSSFTASVVAKATVIAAFGLLGARLARKSRAAVRHVLLAATFGVLLLLPVASLIVPPVRIAVPIVSANSAVAPASALGGEWILPSTPPNAHPAATSAASRSSRPPLSALLFVVWLAGVALALIPMIASLWKIGLLRRSGLPWLEGQKVVNRLSLEAGFRRRVEVLRHEALPGPITSGMLHPTILFPPDAQTWPTEDLNRAAVHELEHARRGDVVTHCLARAICAVYWFHPLVWMAWRQLTLEAERACDDAVLKSSEATAYADQLVALARKLLASDRSPLLAMANRSDLVIRVNALLDARQRRGRAGKFAVVLGCAVAAVLVVTMSPIRMVSAPQSIRSQTKTDGGSPPVGMGEPLPSFEVASIKLHRPEVGDGAKTQPLPGARLRVENQPVRTLIEAAYKVQDFELFGGPGWIKSDRYDIDAKGEGNPPLLDVVGPMLQRLLEERFKLKVHREQRELPLYGLSAAKGGLKIQPAQPESCIPYDPNYKPAEGEKRPVICGSIGIGRGFIDGRSIRMADLTRSLAFILGRPVLDETRFDKVFDARLTFAPNDSPAIQPGAQSDRTPPMAVNNDSADPSITTALQEQLGIKLKSTKGPVEVLVIDHIERPSEN